jgi:hypothetical protein
MSMLTSASLRVEYNRLAGISDYVRIGSEMEDWNSIPIGSPVRQYETV